MQLLNVTVGMWVGGGKWAVFHYPFIFIAGSWLPAKGLRDNMNFIAGLEKKRLEEAPSKYSLFAGKGVTRVCVTLCVIPIHCAG